VAVCSLTSLKATSSTSSTSPGYFLVCWALSTINAFGRMAIPQLFLNGGGDGTQFGVCEIFGACSKGNNRARIRLSVASWAEVQNLKHGHGPKRPCTVLVELEEQNCFVPWRWNAHAPRMGSGWVSLYCFFFLFISPPVARGPRPPPRHPHPSLATRTFAGGTTDTHGSPISTLVSLLLLPSPGHWYEQNVVQASAPILWREIKNRDSEVNVDWSRG
jgi:hypothetical protein